MAQKNCLEGAWTRFCDDWPKGPELSTPTILKYYDTWDNYDDDMEALGYTGPDVLANKLTFIGIPKSSLILDVGCGTGLIGLKLREKGFHNLHGHDGSAGILEKAEKAGVYEKLICCYVGDGQTLPVASGTYDGVVISGSGSPHHFPIDAFEDILRIIKPGGFFSHTSRDTHLRDSELSRFLNQHVEHSRLELMLDEEYDNFYANTKGPSISGRIQIYKVLKQPEYNENGKVDQQPESKVNGKIVQQPEGNENGKVVQQPEGKENGKVVQQPEGKENGKVVQQPEGKENGKVVQQPEGKENGKVVQQPECNENGKVVQQPEGNQNGKVV